MDAILNTTDAAMTPLKAAVAAVLTNFAEFTYDPIFLVSITPLPPPPPKSSGGPT